MQYNDLSQKQIKSDCVETHLYRSTVEAKSFVVPIVRLKLVSAFSKSLYFYVMPCI